MNVSIDGERGLPAARPPLTEITGAPTAPTGQGHAPAGGHRWTASVEALAAHWQAALGGFHTGVPPTR